MCIGTFSIDFKMHGIARPLRLSRSISRAKQPDGGRRVKFVFEYLATTGPGAETGREFDTPRIPRDEKREKMYIYRRRPPARS